MTRDALSTRWPRELVLLYAATFLAYANISVFFRFYAYLKNLSIDPAWIGFIIGVFSAVSLMVRPVVIPFFHGGNARKYLAVGTLAVVGSLAAYSKADGLWSLILVRVLHGLSFVVLGSALMALLVEYIPRERSAQAFGLLAVVILIPNTLVPPMLPFLDRTLGGFPKVLLLFALVTAFLLPLCLVIRPGSGGGASDQGHKALTGKEILQDLGDVRVRSLLAAMLLFYSGHALVFFFLDPFGRSIGIVATGFFLTLTSAGEIGVRVLAGGLFDRMEKVRLVAGTLIGLAAGYFLLAMVTGKAAFFSLGVFLGLGWGVAMPVFNGLMFDISSARFRAFNTNLGLQMFQAGFFLGPFIGGWVVPRFGFAALFVLCGAMALAAAAVAAVGVRDPRN